MDTVTVSSMYRHLQSWNASGARRRHGDSISRRSSSLSSSHEEIKKIVWMKKLGAEYSYRRDKL
jgi:hypothetical protein